jgi:Na+/proline symporter
MGAISVLDIWVIGGLLLLFLGVGLSQTSRSSTAGVGGYFLAGRQLSWQLAGLSMVATTFAADTPLAVTELVFKYGISGNWLWWNMMTGGMLTAFFFSRLWLRSGVVTDVEFTELRYGGQKAAVLRGFKAVYLGLLMNALVMGWVNLALLKLIAVFSGINDLFSLYAILFAAMVLVALYSALSGLAGVVLTDAVQFVFAMTGCIILAFNVVFSEKIGGISNLVARLPDSKLDFFPTIGSTGETLAITVGMFFSFVALQWWASWYPGAEPGGGGYIAQRMLSTRSEKDAFRAVLFFQIAHYALRPWPWIVVGLCVPLLYPNLTETQAAQGYIMAIRDYLPSGLRGLMLAAFLAAYMSTISTQLNWGASYLVNDLYKRFFFPQADDKQIIVVSKWATVLLMVFSFAVTTQLESVSGAWYFLLKSSAGLGFVLIARWYWWRINGWSEIAAIVAPLLGAWLTSSYPEATGFALTTAFTVAAVLVVTGLTPAEKPELLEKFCQKIKPRGFWKSFSPASPDPDLWHTAGQWLASIALGYAVLFLIGYTILGFWWAAGLCFLVVLAALFALQFKKI